MLYNGAADTGDYVSPWEGSPNERFGVEYVSGPANDAFNEARLTTTPECAGMDIDVFFEQKNIAEAKKVCSTCPLATLCRDAAREREDEFGVFGGESYSERVHAVNTAKGKGVTGKPCRNGLHLMVPENIYYLRYTSVSCNPCRMKANRERGRPSRASSRMRDKRGLFV
jgi:hypothetical protein